MATKNRDRKPARQLSALKLQKSGKPNGFLSYGEVNDALPADAAADQLDDDDFDSVEVAAQVRIAPTRVVEKTVPQRKEVTGDGTYAASNDPVRMYLRKMGTVSLLTRDGEVEIAKRIEGGEHTILGAILSSPVAVREIVDLGDKLRKRKIRVREILRDADFEVTRERIRQIEAKALRKLRHPSRSKQLKSFIES